MTDHVKKYTTRILKVAKKRAGEQGYAFNIDRKWLWERLENGVCEITGIPFVLTHQHGDDGYTRSPWGPSIDKIDPAKGYIKENCRLVCNIYNLMKGEGTDDHVLAISRALVERSQ